MMTLFTGDFFSMLAESSDLHAPGTAFHRCMSDIANTAVVNSPFASETSDNVKFGPYGKIRFPFFSMGNIDSTKLFGLDELIMFSFYYQKRKHYKRAADMGANIGLHSILMSKLGWQVTSFEPDPVHVEQIKLRAADNGQTNICICQSAVASTTEQLTFTRLKGNRTGSHLKGKKENVYGEVEEFTVDCVGLSEIMHDFDFIKMDIEGAEADAICATKKENWENTDIMLEVGSEKNAIAIWEHATKLNLNAFAQKHGWKKLTDLNEMPTKYQDGSLFISKQESSPFLAN